MIQRKQKLRFGDRVLVKSGFYEGETAILTYLCPESGCFCGYIDGDGTEHLHYFYAEELEILDRGYYFDVDDDSEPLEEPEKRSSYPARVVPVSVT